MTSRLSHDNFYRRPRDLKYPPISVYHPIKAVNKSGKAYLSGGVF